jgi:hypothetical protein
VPGEALALRLGTAISTQGSQLMSSSFESNAPARGGEQSRWAPWWVYVAVIAPTNVGKEQFLAGSLAWWSRAALTAAIVVGGIALVTAIHRRV